MIKVLVVDDDKLARKGLISSMPWQQFDMVVVGEAYNGEKALAFLKNNTVDLLLSDLAMPVMSGIELMRIVREKYPKVHIAVLTLHQDFEYVQEALRLGAIDYIAKIQLEKERFEEVLGRIHSRILKEENKKALIELHEKASIPFYSPTGYMFIAIDEQQDAEWLHQVDIYGWNPSEIDNGLWLWVPEEDCDHGQIYTILGQQITHKDGWTLLKIEDIKGENRSVVHRLLRRYRQRGFFYDFDSSRKTIVKSVHQLEENMSAAFEEELHSIKEHWWSSKWMQQEDLFEQMIHRLKTMRLPPSKTIHLLHDITIEWNHLYSGIVAQPIQIPEAFTTWGEMEDWMRAVHKEILGVTDKYSYSQEVIDSIMEALRIVQAELDQQLFAVDVAKRVNISRSYFSHCFKEITGKSFNDFLRLTRIEKAKEYLLQTNQSIQWIAEQIGYMDVKYFSRLFRDQTGMLPSKYRADHRQGRNLSDD